MWKFQPCPDGQTAIFVQTETLVQLKGSGSSRAQPVTTQQCLSCQELFSGPEQPQEGALGPGAKGFPRMHLHLEPEVWCCLRTHFKAQTCWGNRDSEAYAIESSRTSHLLLAWV